MSSFFIENVYKIIGAIRKMDQFFGLKWKIIFASGINVRWKKVIGRHLEPIKPSQTLSRYQNNISLYFELSELSTALKN